MLCGNSNAKKSRPVEQARQAQLQSPGSTTPPVLENLEQSNTLIFRFYFSGLTNFLCRIEELSRLNYTKDVELQKQQQQMEAMQVKIRHSTSGLASPSPMRTPGSVRTPSQSSENRCENFRKRYDRNSNF